MHVEFLFNFTVRRFPHKWLIHLHWPFYRQAVLYKSLNSPWSLNNERATSPWIWARLRLCWIYTHFTVECWRQKHETQINPDKKIQTLFVQISASLYLSRGWLNLSVRSVINVKLIQDSLFLPFSLHLVHVSLLEAVRLTFSRWIYVSVFLGQVRWN